MSGIAGGGSTNFFFYKKDHSKALVVYIFPFKRKSYFYRVFIFFDSMLTTIQNQDQTDGGGEFITHTLLTIFFAE